MESVHSQVAAALRQSFEDLTGKLEGTKAALRGEIERVTSILSRNQLQWMQLMWLKAAIWAWCTSGCSQQTNLQRAPWCAAIISMWSDATWLTGKDAHMQRVARSVSSVCTASTVIFPRQLQPYHVAGRLCATAVIWLYACAFGYDIHIPKKYENRRVSASAETGKSNMTLALTLLMCHSVWVV